MPPIAPHPPSPRKRDLVPPGVGSRRLVQQADSPRSRWSKTARRLELETARRIELADAFDTSVERVLHKQIAPRYRPHDLVPATADEIADSSTAQGGELPDALAPKKARARYTGSAALTALLTYSGDLSGVPVRLLRASWLLKYYQAAANEDERLATRQELEREFGDEPFVSGDVLKRVLAELKRGGFVEAAGGGPILDEQGEPIKCAFSPIAALSHMWLTAAHPDPHGKSLREHWLPAIEWLYSERIRQLMFAPEARAKGADGEPLSDAAALEAADFGIFIE